MRCIEDRHYNHALTRYSPQQRYGSARAVQYRTVPYRRSYRPLCIVSYRTIQQEFSSSLHRTVRPYKTLITTAAPKYSLPPHPLHEQLQQQRITRFCCLLHWILCVNSQLSAQPGLLLYDSSIIAQRKVLSRGTPHPGRRQNHRPQGKPTGVATEASITLRGHPPPTAVIL